MVGIVTLIAAASLYWGAVAPTAVNESYCTGHVSYTVEKPTPDLLFAAAWVDGYIVDGKVLSDCVIRLPPHWRKGLTKMEQCSTIIHEYGHTIGFTHNTPYRVMADGTKEWFNPPYCRKVMRLGKRG